MIHPAPGAKECLNTKNGDELVHPANTDAVKKYFVKIKSSISRKLEKTALAKKSVSMD